MPLLDMTPWSAEVMPAISWSYKCVVLCRRLEAEHMSLEASHQALQQKLSDMEDELMIEQQQGKVLVSGHSL